MSPLFPFPGGKTLTRHGRLTVQFGFFFVWPFFAHTHVSISRLPRCDQCCVFYLPTQREVMSRHPAEKGCQSWLLLFTFPLRAPNADARLRPRTVFTVSVAWRTVNEEREHMFDQLPLKNLDLRHNTVRYASTFNPLKNSPHPSLRQRFEHQWVSVGSHAARNSSPLTHKIH